MAQSNTIHIQRSFACDTTRLFEAFTNADVLTSWFGPKNMNVSGAEIDLRVDGEYTIHLQNEKANFRIKGQYLDIKKPSSLKFTLYYDGLPSTIPQSVVTVTFTSSGSTSTISLLQEFESQPANMESRTESWELMLGKLAAILEGE